MLIPVLLPGGAGSLSGLLFFPDGPQLADRWVVHVPAFAEEMNKSRRMVAEQARALASLGLVVVVPDLSGTGDSPGDFSEADWAAWKADLRAVIAWCGAQGAGYVSLWGLRLGGLLALDVSGKDCAGVDHLLLWQPVTNAKQALTQFLRLRMAAGMIGDGEKESVADLRRRLDAGEMLEVAGYGLSPELYTQLAPLSFAAFDAPVGLRIDWFEVMADPGRALPVPVQRIVASWSTAGVSLEMTPVQGDPFWTTQEIAMAPGLIARSLAAMRGLDGPAECIDRDALIARLAPGPASHSGDPSGEPSLVFSCAGEELVAVLHRTDVSARKGVLLVVGGPQYRVGSHRQFLLLARALAAAGIPVLRFDYRGMGDSSGQQRTFEVVEEDIRAAIDAFQQQLPGLEEIVIWALCDAASAACFYAHKDARVSGLILLNPWVRSEAGIARAYLRHYYLQRLFDPEMWAKIRRGEFAFGASLRSFFSMLGSARGAGRQAESGPREDPMAVSPAAPLAERVRLGLEQFSGRVLLILSGHDLTADEFRDTLKASRPFRKLVAGDRFTRRDLEAADHTFSRAAWRDEVARWSREWLGSW